MANPKNKRAARPERYGCRGPGPDGGPCPNRIFARDLCRTHYDHDRFNHGRALKPIRRYPDDLVAGPKITLRVGDLRKLRRLAKARKIGMYSLARELVVAGLNAI